MKRYLRTNSRIETFNTFKTRHRFNLRKRGYSKNFVNYHTNKVKFLDRSFELKKKSKKTLSSIPFVTRYTPSGSAAFKIIKNYWHHLQNLIYFKKTRLPLPMLSYKSNKNIKSFLIHAKLQSRSLDCDNETTTLKEFGLEYTPLPDSH